MAAAIGLLVKLPTHGAVPLHLLLNPPFLLPISPSDMSFLAASRHVARRANFSQLRSFSSTPATAAAAEVRKLGVIGAGQMVSPRALSQSCIN